MYHNIYLFFFKSRTSLPPPLPSPTPSPTLPSSPCSSSGTTLANTLAKRTMVSDQILSQKRFVTFNLVSHFYIENNFVVMCQQQFLIQIRKMKMIITIILQLSSPPSPGCTRSWTPSRGAVGAGSDAKWCRRKYGTGLLGSQQSRLSGIFYILLLFRPMSYNHSHNVITINITSNFDIVTIFNIEIDKLWKNYVQVGLDRRTI